MVHENGGNLTVVNNPVPTKVSDPAEREKLTLLSERGSLPTGRQARPAYRPEDGGQVGGTGPSSSF